MEFVNPFVNFLQTHGVCVPHGTTAVGGKSVAVEINDVDVGGAQRVSLFENPGAFVYQRIDATIDDFVVGDLSLRDSRFSAPLTDQRGHLGIPAASTIFVVAIPSL